MFVDRWSIPYPIDKPIIRLFSPLLRPLFGWNHRWTMNRGEEALKRRLDSSSPG